MKTQRKAQRETIAADIHPDELPRFHNVSKPSFTRLWAEEEAHRDKDSIAKHAFEEPNEVGRFPLADVLVPVHLGTSRRLELSVSMIDLPHSLRSGRSAFALRRGSDRILFSASSMKECFEWVNAIERARDQAREDISPLTIKESPESPLKPIPQSNKQHNEANESEERSERKETLRQSTSPSFLEASTSLRSMLLSSSVKIRNIPDEAMKPREGMFTSRADAFTRALPRESETLCTTSRRTLTRTERFDDNERLMRALRDSLEYIARVQGGIDLSSRSLQSEENKQRESEKCNTKDSKTVKAIMEKTECFDDHVFVENKAVRFGDANAPLITSNETKHVKEIQSFRNRPRRKVPPLPSFNAKNVALPSLETQNTFVSKKKKSSPSMLWKKAKANVKSIVKGNSAKKSWGMSPVR